MILGRRRYFFMLFISLLIYREYGPPYSFRPQDCFCSSRRSLAGPQLRSLLFITFLSAGAIRFVPWKLAAMIFCIARSTRLCVRKYRRLFTARYFVHSPAVGALGRVQYAGQLASCASECTINGYSYRKLVLWRRFLKLMGEL